MSAIKELRDLDVKDVAAIRMRVKSRMRRRSASRWWTGPARRISRRGSRSLRTAAGMSWSSSLNESRAASTGVAPMTASGTRRRLYWRSRSPSRLTRPGSSPSSSWPTSAPRHCCPSSPIRPHFRTTSRRARHYRAAGSPRAAFRSARLGVSWPSFAAPQAVARRHRASLLRDEPCVRRRAGAVGDRPGLQVGSPLAG